MNWKITSFKPGTNEVSVRHMDGELMELIIPEEHRLSAAVKLAYIKTQTDARDAVKEIEASKVLTQVTKKAQERPYLLLGIIVAQTIAIIALLVKVL